MAYVKTGYIIKLEQRAFILNMKGMRVLMLAWMLALILLLENIELVRMLSQPDGLLQNYPNP